MIREAEEKDFTRLMALYMQLHHNEFPEETPKIKVLWQRIMGDSSYHLIIAEEDGRIVSSCTCIIIPNLTHHQQSYALIENVVTDKDYRKKGLATRCLEYAKALALDEQCYKIMLLTGAKDEATLKFYEHAGFNREDKTAFIQWL